jgi:hypothetical protein
LNEILDVDPMTLHLPFSRWCGADPEKLQRQISRYGVSTAGMPLIEVYRCRDGVLLIDDGATRATRVAKLVPGQTVKVVVKGRLAVPRKHFPTVGERLP